jgi:hypothetical protein
VSRIEDRAAHVHPVDRRERWDRTVSAERDGVLEGSNEDFAIRTSSQMLAYFPTNVGREFVVDIG